MADQSPDEQLLVPDVDSVMHSEANQVQDVAE
jgi:hypothetical protein